MNSCFDASGKQRTSVATATISASIDPDSLSAFDFMGIPFGDGCGDLHRKPAGIPTTFNTHRHSILRTGRPGACLPGTLADGSHWCAGAVGVLSFGA